MSKIISYGICLVIIIGLLFPIGNQYNFLIPILLATILFFSFLDLEYKFKYFFRKELFYYVVIGLIIIPSSVFFLTINLETNLRLGIFLVSITPTAIGAPIIVDIIKGNKELIVSNVILYNVLSPITYSLLLHLFFNKSDLVLPTKLIFIKLTIMIFIPFILALISRNFISLKDKLIKISKYVSPISFILVIGVAVSSVSLNLRQLETIKLFTISFYVFILAVCSFYVGSVLSRQTKMKRTLAIVFGHKNSALTIWIGLSNFVSPVIIPMIIYIIFHHIINAILIHKYINSQE